VARWCRWLRRRGPELLGNSLHDPPLRQASADDPGVDQKPQRIGRPAQGVTDSTGELRLGAADGIPGQSYGDKR
jgi:hypothetical protein